MEPILYLFGGVASLIAVLGGSIAAIFVAWSGIQWMMAGGDPQKISQARASIIGTMVGLVLVGSSFIIPDAINQRILRPSGAHSVMTSAGVDCDGALKNNLISARWAGNAPRMQRVVQSIQSQIDGCSSEIWHPVIYDGVNGSCSGHALTQIGSSKIPKGLLMPGSMNRLKWGSGRDSENNIFVDFGGFDDGPSDSADCWLYVSRLKIWDRSY